jgi:hypothetical protein
MIIQGFIILLACLDMTSNCDFIVAEIAYWHIRNNININNYIQFVILTLNIVRVFILYVL